MAIELTDDELLNRFEKEVNVVRTRADELVKLVKQRGELSFEDAAKQLSVSTSTIEAWANFLEEEKIISIKYNFTTPFLTVFQEKIKKELKNAPKSILADLDINGKINIPKIKGCKACNFTGYKGRVGIFEAFLITDEVEALILKNPAIFEIKELISKNGMLYMRQDGLIKVLQGITTTEEVDRVTGK